MGMDNDMLACIEALAENRMLIKLRITKSY